MDKIKTHADYLMFYIFHCFVTTGYFKLELTIDRKQSVWKGE